ncbi:MAG TPA: metallophosphoesterase family protein [Longimicrobium sp.]|jgi:hypothetical protein
MAVHREEFLLLPHLSHDSALIAWGAFFFDPEPDGEHELIDHEDLARPDIGRRRGCIGLETESYGGATVRVTRLAAGGAPAETRDLPVPGGRNHLLVTGLRPDTRYAYEVRVDGRPWGATPSDFAREGSGRDVRLSPAAWRYRNEFTTFPDPHGPPVPVTFAVLGDQGSGKQEQYDVAAALEAAVDRGEVRFIVTTGDNVYAQVKHSGLLGLLETGVRILTKDLRSSGNEDDDWFATFFLPYRRIINRVPVFPSLGNHDHAETENEADLAQHIDNFYLAERFPRLAPRWKGPDGRFETMFYRFRCGPDLEMVALDTGRPSTEPAFERPQHKAFIQEVLGDRSRGWKIPYSHHPPLSVGPNHPHEPNVQNLANLFTGLDGFRLWLSGHEHNFQHHRIGDIHYVVSGASGKRAKGVDKQRVHPGASCCHGDAAHFLLVTVDGPRLTLRAIGTDGRLIPTKPLADLPPHPAQINLTL